MTDCAGRHLGSYRLLHLLGRGSFADVYLAEHLHLNTQVAIKVFHTHLTGQDIEIFLTETRTIARLMHPHILCILDFDVQEGQPFLVMDYAPKGTLRTRCPRGTLVPSESILLYVKEAAKALQYAHDQKLIHGDIKPENLLLGRNQEVLLADFGLTALQSSRYQQIAAAGTITYMAPEQLQGHPCPSSDQYALGIVVYEWLSGDYPFHGSFAEIAGQHLFVPPPPLREKVPAVPFAVEQVVLKALAKAPEKRFEHVQAFALALEEAYTIEQAGQRFRHAPERPVAIESMRNLSNVPFHNLPTQLTSLVDREQEVVTARAQLQRPEVRLLTLTGPGGIGKTRLGQQVATDLLNDFTDGVCFVQLASVNDPDLVVPTIAQTLGLRESGDQPLFASLKAYLHEKHLLLFLDNFEQVIHAAPVLTELLASCPFLKFLVTSREVLRVCGEQELRVQPLPLPDLKHLSESEALSQYPAVDLFIQRVQSVKPDFQVTNVNARTIATICTCLDGIPLALELAATRLRWLSPQTLLARLEHRLQVLTQGPRDVHERQQTLRNTIQWSYDLLQLEEKRLFRQLAVFIGGCTLEAAEAISTVPGDGGLPILDGVSSLLDKSLLQRVKQGGEGDEELRFAMLETIREYGLEALAESGEIEVTRQAHAAYYLQLAEQAEPELLGLQQAVWLGRLEREYDNLRAAFSWFLEQGGQRHVEMALRLGAALTRFWMIRGYYSEGRNILEHALARSAGVGETIRAKALSAVATLVNILGDTDRSETLAQESLTVYRGLGDTVGIANALYLLGHVYWLRGNFAAAGSLLEEALALFRQTGDKASSAYTLFNLAGLACLQGAYSRSAVLFEESLALFTELGDKRGMALSHLQYAEVLFVSQGDQVKIRSRLEEALSLCQEVGDKDAIACYYSLLGQVALSQGSPLTAQAQLEESLALYREMGNRQRIAQALSALAKAVAIQGDIAKARTLYQESLALASVGHKLNIALGLEGLASVVAAQGELVWAAQLWGAAETLRKNMGIPLPTISRPDYEYAVTAARTLLGKEIFLRAWAQGCDMSPEQALAAQRTASISQPLPAEVSLPPRAHPLPEYPNDLTAREVEVVRLLAQGLTNAQIAERLILSPHTVHSHVGSILSKLAVSSRGAVIRFAWEHHLV